MSLKRKLTRVWVTMDLETMLGIAVAVQVVLELLVCQYRTGAEGEITYEYPHLLDPAAAL